VYSTLHPSYIHASSSSMSACFHSVDYTRTNSADTFLSRLSLVTRRQVYTHVYAVMAGSPCMTRLSVCTYVRHVGRGFLTGVAIRDETTLPRLKLHFIVDEQYFKHYKKLPTLPMRPHHLPVHPHVMNTNSIRLYSLSRFMIIASLLDPLN